MEVLLKVLRTVNHERHSDELTTIKRECDKSLHDAQAKGGQVRGKIAKVEDLR